MAVLRRAIGLLLIVVGGFALYTILPELIVAIGQIILKNSNFVGVVANTAFVTFGVLPDQPELIFIDVAIYVLVVFIGFVLLLKSSTPKVVPLR